MEITVEALGGTVIAKLAGRLDFGAADDAKARLAEVLAGLGAGGRLVLDAADLTYVSSAGLRVFLHLAKEAKNAGASVALAALQPTVLQVFEISGLTAANILEIHSTVAAAAEGA